jgi:recombination protein RecA
MTSKIKNAIDLPDTEKFSSGLLSLDEITNGGFVVGSIVEIFGEESDGKTTLGLQLLAKAQRDGFHVFYLDAEHSTTKEYLGEFLDLGILKYERPASGEEAYGFLRDFWKEYGDKKNMIFIDSVPALIPESQVETGDANFGPVAMLMAKNLPSILRNYNNSIVIFSNQTRDKITAFGSGGKKTVGGNALKFYAGHRLKLDTVKMILGKEKRLLGKQVKIEVVKNKFGVPFGTTTIDMIFRKGYCQFSDLVEFALKKNIILKEGAWIKYGKEKYHGREALVNELKNNESLFEEIRNGCLDTKKDN